MQVMGPIRYLRGRTDSDLCLRLMLFGVSSSVFQAITYALRSEWRTAGMCAGTMVAFFAAGVWFERPR
jgi:hypothetical protein